MKKCCIIGSMPVERCCIDPIREGFIICADGGYHQLLSLGIKPDVLIGDFDSMHGEIPFNAGFEVVKLNPVKDDTDMLAAIRYGLDRGFNEFELYGGIGGRLDHTYSNIQLLSFLLDRHAQGTIYDQDGNMLTMIQNKSLLLKSEFSKYLSVFSYTDVSYGVSLKGVKYPLNKVTLTASFPIGVSNEFISDSAEIVVENGKLLIMLAQKDQ